MATTQTTIVRESLLTAQDIREMIRDAHGGFAADHVARTLRTRYLEPIEADAAEIVELLTDLVDSARERILAADIEPLHHEHTAPPKLSKRERENVANLAMLLAARSMALLVAGRTDDALADGREGVAWGRAANDYVQQTIVWHCTLAALDRSGRAGEFAEAVQAQLRAARASKSPVAIVEVLLLQSSDLIGKWRLEEAEEIRMEALSILQNDVPEESRHPHYASALTQGARILHIRGQHSEAIHALRKALHWADGDRFPVTRSIIMSQLGGFYLELAQYRQSIECQHEVMKLSEASGSAMIRAWGCLRLAGSHIWLKEYDIALAMLDQADAHAPNGPLELTIAIIVKRAQISLASEDLEEAARLCRKVIGSIGECPHRLHLLSSILMLGEIDERCSRYEAAEENYRHAIDMATHEFPQRLAPAQMGLAGILRKLGRLDEATALLDEATSTAGMHPSYEAKMLRLRAAIAESRGDLRTVINAERDAVAIEQRLLETEAGESLRNARIMARTDLLEREAELERERRKRVERELANAVVALGDRKRQAATVEERLRTVLSRSPGQTERTVTNALQEALVSLRSESGPKESLHHYLSKVDEEFYARLRERFPGLTRKQERFCGLIRTGLNSREIGTLLDLEPEGVKTQRKRLRKRFGMDQEERLEEMLREI